MKQCMRNAMSPRDRATVPAKGIKAMCSGRLGGADIARTESYHEGTIPLQTPVSYTHLRSLLSAACWSP